MRDALQIGAEHVNLNGAASKRLGDAVLRRVAKEMGLDDAQLRLEPLKLLVYGEGGHFASHCDTEKSEGMVASATVVVPGHYEGGTLAIEHAGQTLRFADCGSQIAARRSGAGPPGMPTAATPSSQCAAVRGSLELQ